MKKDQQVDGLPEPLKAGIEALSGMNLDHVRVHYGSARPAGLQALAYTQGTDSTWVLARSAICPTRHGMWCSRPRAGSRRRSAPISA